MCKYIVQKRVKTPADLKKFTGVSSLSVIFRGLDIGLARCQLHALLVLSAITPRTEAPFSSFSGQPH